MLLSDVETEIWDADVISNRKNSHGKNLEMCCDLSGAISYRSPRGSGSA